MTCKKLSFVLPVITLFVWGTKAVFAQAPNISYSSPQTYILNKIITPLSPTNSGGAVPANAYGQVSTFAGSGITGSADGQGTSASFYNPLGIVMDNSGNFIVADFNNSSIRKISPQGLVSTIPLSFAKPPIEFNPFGIAVDGSGNIYTADAYTNLIWKISPAGNAVVLAGSIQGSSNGKDILASFNHPLWVATDNAGNVYVSDTDNALIRKINSNGLVTTFATGFNFPYGLVFDPAGNMYVADAADCLIRKITPNGVVSILAGSLNTAGTSADGTGAAAGFDNPEDIVADKSGNLYVTDGDNNLIRKITSSGVVTTIAGNVKGGANNGIGASAGFHSPAGITIDNTGNLYVADTNNSLIREITLYGYTIDKPLPPGLTFDPTTGNITGTPTAVSPLTNYTVTAYNAVGSSSTIINITVKSSSADVPLPPNISYQTPQTYVVNTTITPVVPANTGGPVPPDIYGQVITIAGVDNSQGNVNGPANTATFSTPEGLAFDASGNLFVSEIGNNDIRKITAAGIVSTFAGNGSSGNVNGPGNSASFDGPNQLVFDPAGNMYVADENNQVIRKITSAGVVSIYQNATFNDPVGLTIDPTGDMYVADRGNSTIREIDQAGQVTTFAVFNGGAAPGNNSDGLSFLCTDVSGNLYFGLSNQAESGTPAGTVALVAGSGNQGFADGVGTAASFNGLGGIAISAGGYIYAADTYNNRIRSISPAGKVTTIAGGPGHGFSDGTASSASFNSPEGAALDATGNFLYVADAGNNVIRKVTVTGYSIDKSLPNGLVFDPATGIISGTPAIASPPETYTITAFNTGGSSTTTVSIQIIYDQTVVFGALPPKTVCDVDFNPAATGSGPITYTSKNTAVATIVSGNVHITGAGTSVITATDGTSQAEETLTVAAATVPTVSISPQSADTCQSSAFTFSAQISGGGANPVLQWQVNGQNAGANSLQFSSSTLNDGDKITCTLTSDAVCTTANTVTSNTALFTIDPPVSTSVKIASSETGPICRGTAVIFTAIAYSPNVNPTYQWQVNGTDAGADQSTFTTANLNDGDVITCILTSTGKCLINPLVTSNAIVIALDRQSQCIITIPNTFTPNGDGINDFWDITALQAYPGCTISIFNRNGSLVYNSINYPKPWDGTYNGSKLPVGTYYYVIDLKNGKKPLAGSVTILR